jgi:hypothetical protein
MLCRGLRATLLEPFPVVFGVNSRVVDMFITSIRVVAAGKISLGIYKPSPAVAGGHGGNNGLTAAAGGIERTRTKRFFYSGLSGFQRGCDGVPWRKKKAPEETSGALVIMPISAARRRR